MMVAFSAFVNNNPTAILEKRYRSFGQFFSFRSDLIDTLALDTRLVRIIVTLYNDDNRIVCNRFIGNYLVGGGHFEYVGPEFARLVASHPEIEC